MNSSKNDIENILLQRAWHYANRSDNASSLQEETRSVVLASLGDLYFGLPIEEISGIIRIQNLAKMPSSVAGFVGLLHHHNQLTSLFHAGYFIKAPSFETTDLHFALILRSKTHPIALGCESVHTIFQLPNSALHSNASFEYQEQLALLLHSQDLFNLLDSETSFRLA